MKTWVKLAGVLLVLLWMTPAFAQSNVSASGSGSFSLQGLLTNTSGTAISDGQHTIMVSVYAQDSANPIYTQTSAVTTTSGVFNLMVGDSGNSSTKLMLMPNGMYSVGISVDGGAQLQPMLQLGSAPSAITSMTSLLADSATTATTALSAKTIGGFSVSANGGANTIPVLNSQGLIPANLLPVGISGSGVSSVNGMTGNVVLTGSGNVALNFSGDTIQFLGSGGALTYPYTQSLSLTSGTGFNITNSLAGTAAAFTNTGTGNALSVTAAAGNALSATGSSTSPAISVSNTGGAALNATSSAGSAITASTSATSSAALQLKSTASTGAQQLLQAVNSTGTTVANLSNTGLLLDGNASGSTSSVLVLQNNASSPGNLLSAVNANDSSVFSLGTNGSATLNSSASNAALTINSATNAAISVTGSASSSTGSALIKLQNMSSDTAGALISAANSAGTNVLSVANNGATKIASTASTALQVASNSSNGVALQATDSASGGTAARLTGGLSLVGPVGTATLSAGNLTQTISNVYAKANSIIMVTVNSTISNLISGLRITGQGSGSFTVGLLSLTALTSDLSFNYLIINQ